MSHDDVIKDPNSVFLFGVLRVRTWMRVTSETISTIRPRTKLSRRTIPDPPIRPRGRSVTDWLLLVASTLEGEVTAGSDAEGADEAEDIESNMETSSDEIGFFVTMTSSAGLDAEIVGSSSSKYRS